MHVGVDATCWPLQRGYGRHARCLLSALLDLDSGHTFTFVTDSPTAAADIEPRAAVRRVRTSVPTTSAASAHGRRSLGDLVAMSRALSDRRFDVVLFPTIYSFVPVMTRARKIVVVHDVIAERYPRLALGSPLSRVLWNAKVAVGRRQADALVTVSEYSRRAVSDTFGLDPASVHVVGEASDPVFRVLANPTPTPALLASGFKPGRRTVVYVGGFAPHKNLRMLVDAFAALANDSRFSDVDLLFVGEYRQEAFFSAHAGLKQRIDDLHLADRARFTGFLGDDDLVVLLNLAAALVLPSLIEGFGLPAVEAAACGCPVIATTASPLPELLRDAALFVDPARPADLEAALRAVLNSADVAQRLRMAGPEAAARLTWPAAATQLAAVIERVGAL